MDLAFNQTQEMIRRTARDFLEARCPNSLVREIEQGGKGYSTGLWQEMAKLGWLGLALPAEYEGGDADIIDFLALSEEVGRALLPSPLLTSSVLCGQLLLNAASPEQKGMLLPPLALGHVIYALAMAETSPGMPSGPPATTATPADGGGYLINGVKLNVPYAVSADRFICGANDSGKLVFVLVEPSDPGITITQLRSIAGFPRCKVEFSDVKAPADSVLPGGEEALAKALDFALLVQCGEMVGRAEKVLELVVDYAKNRVQFGRPIGAFQAIQHQCVDLRVAVDATRLLVYRAGCSLLEGGVAGEEIAMAKAAAGDLSQRSTVVGHGVYAGISYTIEHDMQLYSARNKLAEASLGNTSYQVQRVAQAMGL
jgi:alkylation response protein AidB-like acyl-CoA dehydrogenase